MRNIIIIQLENRTVQDLHIFNTSLAVFAIDLSSDPTKLSATFPKANLFSLFNLNCSIMIQNKYTITNLNCNFDLQPGEVKAQYRDLIRLLEIDGFSSLKVGRKYCICSSVICRRSAFF